MIASDRGRRVAGRNTFWTGAVGGDAMAGIFGTLGGVTLTTGDEWRIVGRGIGICTLGSVCGRVDGGTVVCTLGGSTGATIGSVVVAGGAGNEKERQRMSARVRYALRMGGPNSRGTVGVATCEGESKESMSSAV